MKVYQPIAFALILFAVIFAVFVGCGSGSEAVNTEGLSQITLHVEGMT